MAENKNKANGLGTEITPLNSEPNTVTTQEIKPVSPKKNWSRFRVIYFVLLVINILIPLPAVLIALGANSNACTAWGFLFAGPLMYAWIITLPLLLIFSCILAVRTLIHSPRKLSVLYILIALIILPLYIYSARVLESKAQTISEPSTILLHPNYLPTGLKQTQKINDGVGSTQTDYSFGQKDQVTVILTPVSSVASGQVGSSTNISGTSMALQRFCNYGYGSNSNDTSNNAPVFATDCKFYGNTPKGNTVITDGQSIYMQVNSNYLIRVNVCTSSSCVDSSDYQLTLNSTNVDYAQFLKFLDSITTLQQNNDIHIPPQYANLPEGLIERPVSHIWQLIYHVANKTSSSSC